MKWQRLQHDIIVFFAIAGTLVLALWPHPTLAACGALDLGACVDAAEYSAYYGAAGLAWTIDRTLLQLAYQLDQLRSYLVEVAFTSAYQIVSSFVAPAYLSVLTVALLLACVLFMLVPLTGNLNLVSIRHVLLWTVLTPLLLTVGGQLVGQAEQIRAQVGSALFTQAAAGAPGAIFGTTASDMPSPQPLYPSNPCGTGTLARADGAAMHMDDLAAALLYANAQDIHCPDFAGPSPDIPDAFYATPPGYAFDGYLGNLDSEVERRAAVEGMQRGMIRLFQGVLPALLAVAEALLNLLFSLSLLVLWLGIPLGLLFVAFQPTASGVTSLFRRAIAVFQVSWSSSIVMGLLFACLLASARLGNATAYTGFALGSLVLTLYLCVVAGTTLRDSLLTLNATVQSATGLTITQPVEVAAATGAAALGAAAGGAGLALAGAAAGMGTGRGGYGLAAMSGRLPGIAPVGEVLATMGWVDHEAPLFSGMLAGERSTHNWRAMRLQVRRDAARFAIEQAVEQAAQAAPSNRPPAELDIDRLGDGAQRLVLAVERAEARQDPLLHASAMHLDVSRQLIYTERAAPAALAGLRATTIPRGEANIPQLLLDGYRVQENPAEGTVSYWLPGTPAQPVQAARAGALTGRTAAATSPAAPASAAPAEAQTAAQHIPAAQPSGAPAQAEASTPAQLQPATDADVSAGAQTSTPPPAEPTAPAQAAETPAPAKGDRQ